MSANGQHQHQSGATSEERAEGKKMVRAREEEDVLAESEGDTLVCHRGTRKMREKETSEEKGEKKNF